MGIYFQFYFKEPWLAYYHLGIKIGAVQLGIRATRFDYLELVGSGWFTTMGSCCMIGCMIRRCHTFCDYVVTCLCGHMGMGLDFWDIVCAC